MNREEARGLLQAEIRRLKTLKFAELQRLVDKETVVRVDGASGTTYAIDVEVSAVNENDPILVVTVYVFEVDGRRWLPPNEAASFTITEDDRILFSPDDV